MYSMYACMYVHMYTCIHVCMFESMHVCIYVRMYACMHTYLYVKFKKKRNMEQSVRVAIAVIVVVKEDVRSVNRRPLQKVSELRAPCPHSYLHYVYIDM